MIISVSRRWQDVMKLVWYDIEKLEYSNTPSEHADNWKQETVKNLSTRCASYLKSLNIKNVSELSINTIVSFEKLRSLKSLTLNSIEFKQGDNDNIKIISKMKTLVHLDLKNCTFEKGMPLLSNLVNLKHLNLEGTSGLMKNDLFNIVNKCRDISYLNLNNLITDEWEISATENDLSQIYKLKNLTHLGLQYHSNVTNDLMIKISLNCENIQHLNLCNCSQLTKSGLIALGNFNKLKFLNLSNILDGIDDDVMIKIVNNNFNTLKYLNFMPSVCLSDCGWDSLTKLKNLEHFTVTSVLNGNFKALYLIDVLKECKFLKHIKFGRNIDDDVVEKISNCVNLKSLNLLYTTQISKPAIEKLSKLVNLEKLEISNLDNSSDVLFRKMNKLRYLSCQRSNVTDDCIMSVIKNCQNLEKLDLRGCKKITSKSIIYAATQTRRRTNDLILLLLTDVDINMNLKNHDFT